MTPSVASNTRLELGRVRRHSYGLLVVADSVTGLGFVSILCALAGAFDDGGDALILGAGGAAAVTAGLLTRRPLQRMHRPSPARILRGIASGWLVLVGLGAIVYLATGTIARVDDALVEAAAGFSTTSVTTLDPEGLSVAMQLWRAGTQWMGGIFGILVAVVALPLALRGTVVPSGDTADRLVPTAVLGRRRVFLLYSGFTAVLGIAYAAVGLGARDSVVHALTTVSTGGFSSHADSFVGFGSGPRVVATIGMIVAGSSYFVLWWVIRGRLTPVWRSIELRFYLGLLIVGSALVSLDADGVGVADAIFTAVSAISTTGFAVGDWTILHDSVLMVLLILIGTGSMSASAGGGLRVARARTLVGFASRELHRQLDPHSVIVIKQSGKAIDERALERTTGYQIAHLGLCGLAAFLLAAAGVDVTAAIYTGISVLSTHGPGVGTGPFGSLDEFSAVARIFLIPFMFAGRLTILPLLLGLASVMRVGPLFLRSVRRVLAGGHR